MATSDQLQSIQESVRVLDASLEALRGKFDAAATGLDNFAAGAKGLQTVVNEIQKLDVGNLEEISKRFKTIGVALERIGKAATDDVSKNLKTIGTAIEKIGEGAKEGVAKNLEPIGPALEQIGKHAKESVARNLAPIGTAIAKIGKVADENVASNMKAIGSAIQRIAVNVKPSTGRNLRPIGPALEKIAEHAKPAAGKNLPPIGEGILKISQASKANLGKNLMPVGIALLRIADGAKAALAKNLPPIGEGLVKVAEGAKANVGKNLRPIGPALTKITEGINATVGKNLKPIGTAIQKIGEGAKANIGPNLATMGTALIKIAKSATDEIAKNLRSIGNAIAKIAAVDENVGKNLTSIGFAMATIAESARIGEEPLKNFTRLLSSRALRNALDRMPEQIKELTPGMDKLRKSVKKLGDVSDVARDNMRTMLGGGMGGGSSTRSMFGSTQQGFYQLSSVISPLTVSLLALARVIRQILNTFQVFSEFEFTMARVGGVTRTVGSEFERLNDFAREMGATTIFTANEAAQAMETLGRLGFTAGEILSTLPGVLNVAAGEGIKLADAARIVAVNLNAFELQASDTGRVTNVLAAASISSAASMKDLGIGLRTVGTFAHTAGTNIEETVTMLSKLADAGLTPYRASVALRQLFLQMQVPARAGALDQLAKMGLTVSDINPKVVGLTNAIRTLKERMIEFGIDANRVFTIRASQAFQVLAQVGARALADFTQSITGTNTASMLAERQMDTLHGSFRKLVSVFEEAQLSIGTALVPTIRGATDAIADMIRWFVRLSDDQKAMIANTVLWTAKIVLLTQIIRVLGKLLGFLRNRLLQVAAANVATWGTMDKEALKALTSWQLMAEGIKVALLRVKAFGAAAWAALGPWGVAAAAAVAAIGVTIGVLMHRRKKAEQQREEQDRKEKERIRNEINLRRLLIQRLDEQAMHQHARTFSPEQQRRVQELVVEAKQLSDAYKDLNVQFDEHGRIVADTTEEINLISEAMRRVEAHSQVLTKIEAFRSRQGKVIFNLEERVALKSFAEEIGGMTLKFNNLGEAIFETAKQQEEFMKVMSEFARVREIQLTGYDLEAFQAQRDELLTTLAQTMVGPMKHQTQGTFEGDITFLARKESYQRSINEMRRILSEELDVSKLMGPVGTTQIEDRLKSMSTEMQGVLIPLINRLIGVTYQIDEAERKQTRLEGEEGIINAFQPDPPVGDVADGYLEALRKINESAELKQLKIEMDGIREGDPQSQTLNSNMVAAIREEIAELEKLRAHPDLDAEEGQRHELEVAIAQRTIDLNRMLAAEAAKTDQERVRSFEVSVQARIKGLQDFSDTRLRLNKYMLLQERAEAEELEKIRIGTVEKWRQAIIAIDKELAGRPEKRGKEAADAYKEAIEELTTALSKASNYQDILAAEAPLEALRVQIDETDALDSVTNLREELIDQLDSAFDISFSKIQGILQSGITRQINIEAGNLGNLNDLQLLQDRMDRVKELQNAVFEDAFYQPYEALRESIPEAAASAIRSISAQMETVLEQKMKQGIEGGMLLEEVLEQYSEALSRVSDGFDMSEIISLAARKSKERNEQSKASFIKIVEALDDSLALPTQELEQKQRLFYVFAKAALSFGISFDEFVSTYREIIENLDNEIKTRTDRAKSDEAFQRVTDSGLRIPPAAASIPAVPPVTGYGPSVTPPTGAAAGTPQRTTIGRELSGAYRAPIHGYRERSARQIEALSLQLERVRSAEQAYREQLRESGAKRGDISRDPRIIELDKLQRAIKKQIDVLKLQTETYTRFRESVASAADVMFDSFGSLSNFIKTEAGKIVLSGLNVINQFDLAQHIQRLGVSFNTLTSFFNSFGTSMQAASSIVDFTGRVFGKSSNAYVKNIHNVSAALSGIPGALQQGLGLGGALVSGIGGALGGFAGFLGSGGAFSAQGASLGASLASSLYGAISGKSQLEEEANRSTNIRGARGAIDVRNTHVTIGQIINEVDATVEGLEDVETLADNLGGLFENSLNGLSNGSTAGGAA